MRESLGMKTIVSTGLSTLRASPTVEVSTSQMWTERNDSSEVPYPGVVDTRDSTLHIQYSSLYISRLCVRPSSL